MWGKAYSICPSGIFVPPGVGHQRPEDLAGVAVGVGYHSGSHYSAIQGLEPYLARPQIELSFIGLPYDRLRLALDRKVPAVNVFGAQYYALEQHGFRKIVDTTFMMGFLLSEDADAADVEKYFTGAAARAAGHRPRARAVQALLAARDARRHPAHGGCAAVRPR